MRFLMLRFGDTWVRLERRDSIMYAGIRRLHRVNDHGCHRSMHSDGLEYAVLAWPSYLREKKSVNQNTAPLEPFRQELHVRNVGLQSFS